jgi:type I restriction enzyme, S subunit
MGDSANVADYHVLQKLPSGWECRRLEASCTGIFDCPHSTPELTEYGPYLIRSQDIRSGVFRRTEAAHVSEPTYAERTIRAEPSNGDLLYSREGTYFGIAAEMPHDIRGCLGQRMVLIRPNTNTVNSRYLRFWLNSGTMSAHVQGFRDGSVAERLNLPTIRGLPVALPPLSVQHAIASILGTLDDKIELNRRMNETLEATARAIFKSWFVDFDPVHTRQRLRMPDRLSEWTSLFPASFVQSKSQRIPSGWKLQSFTETVEVVGGGTPKTEVSEYWSGNIPWFSVVDAPDESDVWVMDTEKCISQKGVDNSSAVVLPVGTTIISARGTVGKVALVGVPMAMNQSCYGLRSRWSRHGYYTYFHTRSIVEALRQKVHGSVFDTITRDTLREVDVLCPPAKLVDAFEKVVGPNLSRIQSTLLESRTLSSLRDTLLPKLISGELRIKDAERFVAGG